MCETIELDWIAGVHVSRYGEANIIGYVDLHDVDHDLFLDSTLLVLRSQPNPDRGPVGNLVAVVWNLFDH